MMTVAFASGGSADMPYTAPAFGVADAVKAEKISWYREVLVLEPGSKIFLPFARLLEELGRTAEAMQVLRDGLERHPEFIEARLFLIDVLHKNNQPELCGAEVARLAGLFREYPGFWDAWSAQELGHKPDLSVSLSFLGALFRDCDITFVDVLSAGIKALQGGTAFSAPVQLATPQAGVAPLLENGTQEFIPASEFSATPPSVKFPEFLSASGIVAPDAMPLDTGDVSAEAFADAQDVASVALTSPPPFIFREAPAASGPEAPAEAKCSLRTRSMAEVLAEQGDVRGAVEIYEELLQSCQAVDLPALQARLDDLRVRLGEPVTSTYAGHASASQSVPFAPQPKTASVPPRNGVLDLLEKLAVRLETKARQ